MAPADSNEFVVHYSSHFLDVPNFFNEEALVYRRVLRSAVDFLQNFTIISNKADNTTFSF